MEIPLKPEYETMIRERLEAGQYKTAASVVEEGLRLLAKQENRVSESRTPYIVTANSSGEFDGRSLADLMEEIGFAEGGAKDMSENKAKYLKDFGRHHE